MNISIPKNFSRKIPLKNGIILLTIVSFIILFISLLFYGGLYQNPDSFIIYYILYSFLLFLLIISQIKPVNHTFIFYMICIIFISTSLVTIVFSPHPVCDCFTTVKEAAIFFLQSKNPYSGNYTQVYKNINPDYFIHLPFSFIYVSPFVFFFNDPRFASIFSLIIIAIILRYFLKKFNSANLIIAVILFFPRTSYMIEHMYQEINMLLFFFLFLFFVDQKKYRYAFLSLSLFFSFKQHLLLIAPLFILHKNMRQLFFKNVLFFIVPFLIPLFYLVSDQNSFIKNIFFFSRLNTFTLVLPLQNSLSFPTFLQHLFHLKTQIVQTISYIIFLFGYFVFLVRPHRAFLSIIGLITLIHMFFSYSFFNHYYLILILLFVYIVLFIANKKVLDFEKF